MDAGMLRAETDVGVCVVVEVWAKRHPYSIRLC